MTTHKALANCQILIPSGFFPTAPEKTKQNNQTKQKDKLWFQAPSRSNTACKQ